ncbi:ABC-three component system protein [Kiloniella sp.]|uniref:ABC-three component system protein n=1 Tax=Kiloniella sp. TaxID=1938587 RepID=UPI003A8F85EC
MSQISGLLESLDSEIANGNCGVMEFIDDLQMFHDRRSDEEVVGLDEKLKAAERDDQVPDAQIKKELFHKLLSRLQHYPSAQKLFAYFLARINDVFENHISPHVHELSRREIDIIIDQQIVIPTIKDMGDGFQHFTLTHAHVRGMIYWLADRCFVRWH